MSFMDNEINKLKFIELKFRRSMYGVTRDQKVRCEEGVREKDA